MFNKILVVGGPTGTGKTKLALHLAKVFNGELISVDSRQVYRDLNIGTGKDLELIGTTSIHGINLVGPKQEFSVADYCKAVSKIFTKLQSEGKLPILVGGTGLYIKAIIDGIGTLNVPRNKNLRQMLEKLSVEELFNKLAELDSGKAGSLNISDKQNPRRLVRAIEVVIWRLDNSDMEVESIKNNVFFVGLKAPLETLKSRIEKRVSDRVKTGLEGEIKSLLKKGVTWEHQSMNSFAYKEWRDFFDGKVTRKQVIDCWFKDEVSYAKEQLVWFNKDKRINWFDITIPNFEKQVENRAQKWYKKEYVQEN